MTNPNRFSFLIVLTIILLASLWIMFSRLVAESDCGKRETLISGGNA
jgi:hypothetical protein